MALPAVHLPGNSHFPLLFLAGRLPAQRRTNHHLFKLNLYAKNLLLVSMDHALLLQ
jgi:hypothetical protein